MRRQRQGVVAAWCRLTAEIGPRGSGGRLLDVLKLMLAIDGWDWIPRLLAEGPRVSQSWR